MPANVIYSTKNPLADTLRYVLGDGISISASEPPTGTLGRHIATVNCSRYSCLDEMEAVQSHYGKRPTNPALDIVINFTRNDVSPQEALEIVTDVTRRMWGERHQAVICIHEDTDHLHAHVALNSVSFADGMILQSRFKEQHRLQEMTRQVFREYGLDFNEYEGPQFYNRTHFLHSKGIYTVRDVVINDVSACARNAMNIEQFAANLKLMGYSLNREEMTVSPERWSGDHKLNYKLSRLGMTGNTLEGIFLENEDTHRGNFLQYNRKFLSLAEHIPEFPDRSLDEPDLISYYELLIYLLKKEQEFMEEDTTPYPLEFSVRSEFGYIGKRTAELDLLKKHGIGSAGEIKSLQSEQQSSRASLEKRRAYLYNKIKAKTLTPQERASYESELSEVKKQLKELIREQKTASSAYENSEMVMKAVELEIEAERKVMEQERSKEDPERDKNARQRT
ncbi:MAG: relaxase/mobilization nuclease domain-containing protein, partial [Oscillospiraceae bacterium]|nr:relaxase/mobilization nuclease domain-containing protein [Oscillospiraceae bacterium]